MEKIARAAIKYRGEVWHAVRPGRHHTIMRAHFSMYGKTNSLSFEEHGVQGFVTTTGRFVDRKEAVVIAVRSGQIDAPQWPPDLYSEDLW